MCRNVPRSCRDVPQNAYCVAYACGTLRHMRGTLARQIDRLNGNKKAAQLGGLGACDRGDFQPELSKKR
ncbi:hypothetical protein [uncultured Rhodoblastus sp.]|uniref:hypothetical protein n=1 Tax=uncultured Rhodoblastus sp. TaxID=543037 RepID=UPI0025E78103|nr:hypothetical protein [uncultured Rhodoblastus sp.]